MLDMAVDGAVIYSDGSARPNKGNIGAGYHGYFYTLADKEHRVQSFVHTQKGYMHCKYPSKEQVVLVKPELYFESSCSYPGEIESNNTAEIRSCIEALEKFKDIELKELAILSDSRLVVQGIGEWLSSWVKNNFKTRNGESVKNKEDWTRLNDTINHYKSKNVVITVSWVKGHNGSLGNLEADILAGIGTMHSRENIKIEDVIYYKPKDMFKPSPERHPFLSHNRLYYGTLAEYNKPGHYYLADGDNQTFIPGKRLPETSLSVVRIKEPDNILELVRDRQIELHNGHNTVQEARLDTVLGKNVYRFLETYGKHAAISARNNNNLITINELVLSKSVTPSGLVLRLLDAMQSLDTVLNDFISNDGTLDTVLGFDAKLYDITEVLFDKVEKKSGKSIVESYVLKKDIGTGSVDVPMAIEVDVDEGTKKIGLAYKLGLDILNRNSLKRLEKSLNKITLITWKESLHTLRFATIIETDNDIGIWSNYYADRLFVNFLTSVK